MWKILGKLNKNVKNTAFRKKIGYVCGWENRDTVMENFSIGKKKKCYDESIAFEEKEKDIGG